MLGSARLKTNELCCQNPARSTQSTFFHYVKDALIPKSLMIATPIENIIASSPINWYCYSTDKM